MDGRRPIVVTYSWIGPSLQESFGQSWGAPGSSNVQCGGAGVLGLARDVWVVGHLLILHQLGSLQVLEYFPLIDPLLSEEVEPGFELHLGEAEGDWRKWKSAVTEVPPSPKSRATITLVNWGGGSHDLKRREHQVGGAKQTKQAAVPAQACELFATTSQLGALSWNRWSNACAACVTGVPYIYLGTKSACVGQLFLLFYFTAERRLVLGPA